MGKKGGWFSALRRAFGPESSDKKDKKARRSKRWFWKQRSLDLEFASAETTPSVPSPYPPPPQTSLPPPPPQPLPAVVQKVKLSEAENEPNKHTVAPATTAADVVRLTNRARYLGKSTEEIAAIKIQTAFRGYLARRAFWALRRLIRLKSLIQGKSVKRQTSTTLRCMQTLVRVQSQIRARRIRMLEENQTFQRQLEQKGEKELEKLRSMGEWSDSTKSKEQIEARIQSKQEAAMRRERALAYSHAHQQMWRNSSKSESQTLMDPNTSHWGWNWLERWMAARPWENRSITERELYSDNFSVKSRTSNVISVGEISRAYSLRNANLNNSNPSPIGQKMSRSSSFQSPSTPPSKTSSSASVAGKFKGDDDPTNIPSVQSERYRRNSIGVSSVRDDESLGSSPSFRSCNASTKSAKSKARLPSTLRLERNNSEKGSGTSAKKRLSFSSSPAGPRNHTGSLKVGYGSHKDISVNS